MVDSNISGIQEEEGLSERTIDSLRRHSRDVSKKSSSARKKEGGLLEGLFRDYQTHEDFKDAPMPSIQELLILPYDAAANMGCLGVMADFLSVHMLRRIRGKTLASKYRKAIGSLESPAVADIEGAVQLATYLIAEPLAGKNRLLEAQRILIKAESVAPKNPIVNYHIGLCDYMIADKTGHDELFSEVIKRTESAAQQTKDKSILCKIHTLEALVHSQLYQDLEMIASLEAAQDNSTTNRYANLALSIIYKRKSENLRGIPLAPSKEEIDLLRQRLSPDAKKDYNQGLNYISSDRTEEAVQAFRKAAGNLPDDFSEIQESALLPELYLGITLAGAWGNASSMKDVLDAERILKNLLPWLKDLPEQHAYCAHYLSSACFDFGRRAGSYREAYYSSAVKHARLAMASHENRDTAGLLSKIHKQIITKDRPYF